MHSYAPKHSVRIVIQHTRQQQGWSFRLIAYEDKQTYRPVQFQTAEDLLKAIRSVIPTFSESDLVLTKDADRSYVAFSTDWEFTDDQLTLLGLKP